MVPTSFVALDFQAADCTLVHFLIRALYCLCKNVLTPSKLQVFPQTRNAFTLFRHQLSNY